MANFKCPFCKKSYLNKDALMEHMLDIHGDQLNGLPPQQVYFNYKNKYALTKDHGISVMSGKPTKFNLVTCRYERFADEKDRQAYREMFKQRMKKTYGVENLLNDPEQQKKMLENRHISGVYKWADGTTTTYTGTYEKRFLMFLENELCWENPNDVMAPAPMIFPYKDEEGNQHFHIPDFYITSLNLIVNIKSSDNKHYRLRDIKMEHAQDAAIAQSKFNYIKIYENEFSKFQKIIDAIRINPDKRVLVESMSKFLEGKEDNLDLLD